jgi:hypothetical protein
MANEMKVKVTIEVDPDLVKLVKSSTQDYTDAHTGELIPKGAPYYRAAVRQGRNLVNFHFSVPTYERILKINEKAV